MSKFSFTITRGTDMSFLVSGLLLSFPGLSVEYKDTIVKTGLFRKAVKRKYVLVGATQEIDRFEKQLKVHNALY